MIEYRSTEDLPERLPALAADLVRRRVTVLVTNSSAPALAAKQATSTLPIVFLIGGDPVELGLVASLNRPGGNATGVSFLINKLVAKRLELLSDLVPGASPLGILLDPNNPNANADTKDAREAAQAIGRKLLVVEAGTKNELNHGLRGFGPTAGLRATCCRPCELHRLARSNHCAGSAPHDCCKLLRRGISSCLAAS